MTLMIYILYITFIETIEWKYKESLSASMHSSSGTLDVHSSYVINSKGIKSQLSAICY